MTSTIAEDKQSVIFAMDEDKTAIPTKIEIKIWGLRKDLLELAGFGVLHSSLDFDRQFRLKL